MRVSLPVWGALVAAVEGGGAATSLPRPLSHVGEAELVRAAAAHGIAPFVSHAFAGTLGRADVVEQLRREEHRRAGRHLLALAVLDRVGAAFATAGIDWLAVKGPVVAEQAYPRPVLRSYADVDIVVPPARFADAVEALEAVGSTVYERNWRRLLDEMKGELNLVTPWGLTIDLHWSLLHDRRLRLALPADRIALFGTADGPTRPAAREHAVYLAVHACLCGADRLGQLADLRWLLRRHDLDEGDVERTARSAGVWLPVSVSLGRMQQALGGRRVSGSGHDAWSRAMAALTTVRGPRHWAVGRGTGRTLVASTRSTGARSLATAVARIGREAALVLRDGSNPWRPRPLRRPAPPNDWLRSTPGRGEYLAAVARQRGVA